MKLNNKINTKSITQKMNKGINNIASPTLINLFIVFSLLIILTLSYLKYNKVELYTGNSSIINDSSQNTASSLLNNYIKNVQFKNQIQSVLDSHEAMIQNRSQKINNLLY